MLNSEWFVWEGYIKFVKLEVFWSFDLFFLDFGGEMLKNSSGFPSVIIKVFLNCFSSEH